MLHSKSSILELLLVLFLFASTSDAREWKSAVGDFTIDAEAVSFSDTLVVLKRPTGQLVAVEFKDLSAADQEYVRSKEVKEAGELAAEEMQTWTSKDGMKVRGRVVAYGRKELVVQRKLGHVHINDRRFSTIDPLHQRLLLRILSELEKTKLGDEKQLDTWARKLGGSVQRFMLEGVLLELESGDEISVPFFMFAPEELAILEPGWELWKERAASDEERDRESFLVQSTAMAYQKDRAAQQQIEMLKLDMLGAIAGITAIWEVGLVPGPGTFGRPMTVMVTAQNSDAATLMAMQRYPGYVLVGVRQASRR